LVRLNWVNAPKADRTTAEVAKAFIENIRACHAEPNAIERDEIVSRQLFALKQHHAEELRIHDVKEMFERMKDHA
jgi:hypothetical protein